MAKAILICGRLCCGKTTYAQQLRLQRRVVLLSLDELMLRLFGEYLGDRHEECAEKGKAYLLDRALEILNTGVDVILDWGFWRREQRKRMRAFFRAHGIETEFHYVYVEQNERESRCAARNAQIDAGKVLAYHVDEKLAEKADRLFEEPERSEMDIWYENSEKNA